MIFFSQMIVAGGLCIISRLGVGDGVVALSKKKKKKK